MKNEGSWKKKKKEEVNSALSLADEDEQSDRQNFYMSHKRKPLLSRLINLYASIAVENSPISHR